MRYLISLWIILIGCPVMAQDLALALPAGDILQPVSGCSLGSTENVTVRIFNFGTTLSAGTSFNVSYTVNGGAPVTELLVLSSNLLSHSSLTYTFTTQANLSTPGNYTLAATVSLPGDINSTNNAFTGQIVTNTAVPLGGSVSADQSICGVTNSGALTLSGQAGTINRWETSVDGGITWRYVSQTTTQQNFLNLTTTTQYRAVVENGACGEAMSSSATVTITCGLPLTWISFDARRTANDVELEWQTADEVNTAYFAIERSVADNTFQTIERVPAQSPSGHYHFSDRNAPISGLQYRIKQVDLDDKYTYSPIRVIGATNGGTLFSLRNNPVKGGILSFNLQGYPTGNAVITIFTMSGKKIQSGNVRLNGGYQTINIPIHQAAGTYLMIVQSGKVFIQKKFIIGN